jgi:3-oxoacyl-[acyl-carrier protein] reductase
MQLINKNIVITGVARGLGRAMALRLAEQGANIIGVDLHEEKLNETIALCNKRGTQNKAYLANISDETSVVGLFNQIAMDYTSIDGLINNAGIVRDALLVKYDREGHFVSKKSFDDWNAVINTNLTGVFLCTRECVCKMIEAHVKGIVINISSISRAGNVGQTNYTAAKAGVAAITVTWAKELARYGIRVAGIAPGFIATEMVETMKPELIERVKETIPLRRMGTADEIAHTVQFIFENDYITGRVIECDGGLRI